MTHYGPPSDGVTTPPRDEHTFDPGLTGMSDACNALVMRDGTADDCGLPPVHIEHGLDPWCRGCNPGGQSAYPPCANHVHAMPMCADCNRPLGLFYAECLTCLGHADLHSTYYRQWCEWQTQQRVVTLPAKQGEVQ